MNIEDGKKFKKMSIRIFEVLFYCRIESVQLILLNNEEKQPSLVSAGQDGLVKYWDLNK